MVIHSTIFKLEDLERDFLTWSVLDTLDTILFIHYYRPWFNIFQYTPCISKSSEIYLVHTSREIRIIVMSYHLRPSQLFTHKCEQTKSGIQDILRQCRK